MPVTGFGAPFVPNRIAAGLVALVALVVLTWVLLWLPAVTHADVVANAWAAAHRRPWLTEAMLWVSAVSGPSIVSVYAGVLLLAFLIGRQWKTALAVALVVYGGLALNVAVKHLVHRARPDAGDALRTLATFSYPSGHAAAVTVFGGCLMLLLAERGSLRSRCAARGAIAIWIVLVMSSRVYLGAHYPSDVLGGVLEGVAWVLLVTAALEHWGMGLSWPVGSRARGAAAP